MVSTTLITPFKEVNFLPAVQSASKPVPQPQSPNEFEKLGAVYKASSIYLINLFLAQPLIAKLESDLNRIAANRKAIGDDYMGHYRVFRQDLLTLQDEIKKLTSYVKARKEYDKLGKVPENHANNRVREAKAALSVAEKAIKDLQIPRDLDCGWYETRILIKKSDIRDLEYGLQVLQKRVTTQMEKLNTEQLVIEHTHRKEIGQVQSLRVVLEVLQSSNPNKVLDAYVIADCTRIFEKYIHERKLHKQNLIQGFMEWKKNRSLSEAAVPFLECSNEVQRLAASIDKLRNEIIGLEAKQEAEKKLDKDNFKKLLDSYNSSLNSATQNPNQPIPRAQLDTIQRVRQDILTKTKSGELARQILEKQADLAQQTAIHEARKKALDQKVEAAHIKLIATKTEIVAGSEAVINTSINQIQSQIEWIKSLAKK